MMASNIAALRIDEQFRHQGRRRRLLVGAIVLATAIALAALGGKSLRTQPHDSDVFVVHLASTSSSGGKELDASGYVTATRRATVAAKITGLVKRVYVEEGMRVKAGQIIAELDDTDARVKVRAAIADRTSTAALLNDLRVNLENAEIELSRSEELYKNGIVTQQAVDNSRTTVRSYRARIGQIEESIGSFDAKIAIATQDLSDCTIRAPYDGTIVSKDAQPGEMASPVSAGSGFTRTGIATLVDMNSLEVEVDVNESYISLIKPGQPATSVLDAYPDSKIPSQIRTIMPTADRQKATVKVKVAFDKRDPRILPDMGVKVAFLLHPATSDGTTDRTIAIPRTAIRLESENPIIFLLRNGRAARTPIRLGPVQGDTQEVTAVLREGDEIIITPQTLHDGEYVKPNL